MHARLLQVIALCLSLSCEGTTEEDDGPPPPLKDRGALLDRIGRPHRLLVGLGNDLPGAEKNFDTKQAHVFGLPASLDLHYVYLSGLKGEPGKDGPGWPEYEPDGNFVTRIATDAAEKNIVPMFTLYQVAARGEERFDLLVEDDFMTKYWAGVRLLFDKLAAFGKPALVHLEPDFWGFAQRQANDDPTKLPVTVAAKVDECKDLPDDVSGMGKCIVRLARAIAPNVALGFHASGFGSIDRPKSVAKFLLAVGAHDADFVAVDTLDRDAGCFEAGVDPLCRRSDGLVYWDVTNRATPNFEDHFAWAKTVHERTGLPVLWWQTPLGVPSDKPGGTSKKYRDNRVKYFFEHPDEIVAAGGFGMAFGTGAPNQTDVTTDDGQFANAVTKYYGAPASITSP